MAGVLHTAVEIEMHNVVKAVDEPGPHGPHGTETSGRELALGCLHPTAAAPVSYVWLAIVLGKRGDPALAWTASSDVTVTVTAVAWPWPTGKI